MKNYLKISIWIITLIVVFGLACESESSDVTNIRAVEPAAPVEAQTKAAQAEAEETVKAEAEKEVKIEAEEQAKVEAEAEQTAKAESVAEEKTKAEIKDKAETKEQAKAEIKQTTQAKVKAEETIQAEPKKEVKVEVEQAEGKDKTEAVVEAKTPAEEPVKTAKTGIAVTVDGIDIAESEVEARIKPQLDKMVTQRKKIPPQFVEQYKKQLMQQALEGIIVEKLLDKQVKAEKIVTTEEDVIAHLKELGSQQQPPLSLENIKAIMESRGQTFDQAKQQIKKGLSYRKLFEGKFDDRINVTEEDAQEYYSENRKQFETPEQVRASHILIKPDTAAANTDPNEAKAKAKTKAQDLLKQIKEGADFAELARANSACNSAEKGGDLGFQPRGSWVRPFEKVAFALESGQVSDIVQTRFGYHIIKVTDRKEAGVATFEQAKDDILNMLKAKKQSELAAQYIESLKAEANIVYPAGKEPESSNFNAIPPQ